MLEAAERARMTVTGQGRGQAVQGTEYIEMTKRGSSTYRSPLCKVDRTGANQSRPRAAGGGWESSVSCPIDADNDPSVYPDTVTCLSNSYLIATASWSSFSCCHLGSWHGSCFPTSSLVMLLPRVCLVTEPLYFSVYNQEGERCDLHIIVRSRRHAHGPFAHEATR